jgi:hypothetical protein
MRRYSLNQTQWSLSALNDRSVPVFTHSVRRVLGSPCTRTTSHTMGGADLLLCGLRCNILSVYGHCKQTTTLIFFFFKKKHRHTLQTKNLLSISKHVYIALTTRRGVLVLHSLGSPDRSTTTMVGHQPLAVLPTTSVRRSVRLPASVKA